MIEPTPRMVSTLEESCNHDRLCFNTYQKTLLSKLSQKEYLSENSLPVDTHSLFKRLGSFWFALWQMIPLTLQATKSIVLLPLYLLNSFKGVKNYLAQERRAFTIQWLFLKTFGANIFSKENHIHSFGINMFGMPLHALCNSALTFVAPAIAARSDVAADTLETIAFALSHQNPVEKNAAYFSSCYERIFNQLETLYRSQKGYEHEANQDLSDFMPSAETFSGIIASPGVSAQGAADIELNYTEETIEEFLNSLEETILHPLQNNQHLKQNPLNHSSNSLFKRTADLFKSHILVKFRE